MRCWSVSTLKYSLVIRLYRKNLCCITFLFIFYIFSYNTFIQIGGIYSPRFHSCFSPIYYYRIYLLFCAYFNRCAVVNCTVSFQTFSFLTIGWFPDGKKLIKINLDASSRPPKIFILYIFWRVTVCWQLLCICRSFCIFERCLDSNPESCRSKQARHQLSNPSPGMVPVFIGCGSQIKCRLLHVTGCRYGISLIRKPALLDSVLWYATP
jgi:hypothetical protein